VWQLAASGRHGMTVWAWNSLRLSGHSNGFVTHWKLVLLLHAMPQVTCRHCGRKGTYSQLRALCNGALRPGRLDPLQHHDHTPMLFTYSALSPLLPCAAAL
jgi:hypothetical protein